MTGAASRQHSRFLFLYALAAAGGSVAFVPFITLLLPMRVAALAGSQDIEWLAYVSLAGALAASIANISFGWLSDVTRNRRGWIVAGLILSSLGLISIPAATSLGALITLVAVWQIGLNMMLAPLAAWAGDCVPDAQKGWLGGLLVFSPAFGALAGVLVTLPVFGTPDTRLAVVVVMVTVMVLPALLFARPTDMPQLVTAVTSAQKKAADKAHPKGSPRSRSTIQRMWIARLMIQISEATLFAFLLFWFRSVDPSLDEKFTARIFGIVLVVAVPVALIIGRLSDRFERPFLPLALLAGISTCGLLVIVLSGSIIWAVAGYLLFSLPAAVFLSLHTGQTLRVLPRPQRRGRDLGLFNLTNTLPSMIMPWLALALVPVFGFTGLFAVLAVFALLATILLAALAREMRPIT